MKPLLRAMFLSPAFRDPSNRGALIKSPVDLIVGTVHVLGLPVPEKTQLVRMMQGLGQLPFNPPNVKGWAGGESWITTYTLLLRQQFLRRMVEATTVSSMDGDMAMALRPNRRAERREQAPADEGDAAADGAGAAGRGPQPAQCRRGGAARADAGRHRRRRRCCARCCRASRSTASMRGLAGRRRRRRRCSIPPTS